MKWIDFVKVVSKRDNLKFNEALKVASKEYHDLNGTTRKVREKSKYNSRLTGKKILKVLKSKLDSGELKGGMTKKLIVDVLRNETSE